MSRGKVQSREVRHGRLLEVDPANLRPFPEDDTLYNTILPTDKSIQELVESIRENDVIEPLLATDFDPTGVLKEYEAALAYAERGWSVLPMRMAQKRRDFHVYYNL